MNTILDALDAAAAAWWPYVLNATWQATLLAVLLLVIVRRGRRWPSPLRYGLLLIALAKFAVPPQEVPAAGQPASPNAAAPSADAKFDGRTIAEWIERWHFDNYMPSMEAQGELIKIGEPAVPALIALIKANDRKAGQAFYVLSKMGPGARQALPFLMEIAGNREGRDPAGWTWNLSQRQLLLNDFKNMSWAADTLIPFLQKTAECIVDDEKVRAAAASALGGMDARAIPLLEGYSTGSDTVLREPARSALADLVVKEGKETQAQYWTRVIERDLFDPSVPEYLGHVTNIVNSSRPFPLREKVKAAHRRRLREKPDPELAWRLARIIQDQLMGTDIEWAVPSDSAKNQWMRESPTESFVTMAEVLELGFQHAEKNSELWTRFGVALAKLRLLQGDWDRMNEALTKLGYSALPNNDRPWLPAPPVKWNKDLRAAWGQSDDSMRSGNCGLIVRIEKDGKGLPGAHVLVKHQPPRSTVFRTGIEADTLFLAPLPLATYGESFGCLGDDRLKTRYGVSDESGEVRLDKLPKIPIKLEVLIPTANFPEAGRAWDLYMEVQPGKLQQVSMHGGRGMLSPRDPGVGIELQEGKTVRYPLLVVQPQFGFNIEDWAQVDKEKFVLHWEGFTPPADKKVHYELKMILTAPSQFSGLVDSLPAIRSTSQTLLVTEWPVGQKGVGGLRLEPGNMYIFEVTARDEFGKTLVRWGKTCVWVPWGYRETEPPATLRTGRRLESPIHQDVYFRSTFSEGERTEDLPQRVERYLRENPKAFEYDYARVGKAWLDWHAGKKAEARTQLIGLGKELPKGSMAQATALSLLAKLEAGEPAPRSLKFVPIEALDSSAISTLKEKAGIRF